MNLLVVALMNNCFHKTHDKIKRRLLNTLLVVVWIKFKKGLSHKREIVTFFRFQLVYSTFYRIVANDQFFNQKFVENDNQKEVLLITNPILSKLHTSKTIDSSTCYLISRTGHCRLQFVREFKLRCGLNFCCCWWLQLLQQLTIARGNFIVIRVMKRQLLQTQSME